MHTLSQIIQEHLKQRSAPVLGVTCSLLPENLAHFGERGGGILGFICIYEQTEALAVLNWSLMVVGGSCGKTDKWLVLREQGNETKHHTHCFTNAA